MSQFFKDREILKDIAKALGVSDRDYEPSLDIDGPEKTNQQLFNDIIYKIGTLRECKRILDDIIKGDLRR